MTQAIAKKYPNKIVKLTDGERIKETEISEIIVGHGVRSYPYTQEGDVLTLISGGDPDIWSVVESTEHSMKIDTSIGRYVLTR